MDGLGALIISPTRELVCLSRSRFQLEDVPVFVFLCECVCVFCLYLSACDSVCVIVGGTGEGRASVCLTNSVLILMSRTGSTNLRCVV